MAEHVITLAELEKAGACGEGFRSNPSTRWDPERQALVYPDVAADVERLARLPSLDFLIFLVKAQLLPSLKNPEEKMSMMEAREIVKRVRG